MGTGELFIDRVGSGQARVRVHHGYSRAGVYGLILVDCGVA